MLTIRRAATKITIAITTRAGKNKITNFITRAIEHRTLLLNPTVEDDP